MRLLETLRWFKGTKAQLTILLAVVPLVTAPQATLGDGGRSFDANAFRQPNPGQVQGFTPGRAELGEQPVKPAARTGSAIGSIRFVGDPTGTLSQPTSASSSPWCDSVVAGLPGVPPLPIGLSTAHNLVRLFSVVSAYASADAGLALALGAPDALTPSGIGGTLDAYADDRPDVCSLAAAPDALGPAIVQLVGRTAIVTPGSGPVTLPPNLELVVIDLRALPAVPGLSAALERALSPALARPVARPARWVRGGFGPVDEVFSPNNIYSNFTTLVEQPPFPATGSRDLPLVIITAPHMPPAAAEFAGALRMAGRAAILGGDVLAEVAEAEWRAIGNKGVAVRTEVLDRVFRRVPPTVLENQVVQQDDPFSLPTSYVRDLIVSNDDIHQLRVAIDGRPGADLDLYLMLDVDGDGQFLFPQELQAASGGPTADEEVTLVGAPATGHYQIWVHGYSVPRPGTTRFALTIDQLSGQIWPDIIEADDQLSGNSTQAIVDQARQVSRTPRSLVAGPVARPFIRPVSPYGQVRPIETNTGQMRAALIIAHGMVRRFYPYFDVAGDGIDARLLETLGAVSSEWDGVDRDGARDLLRRFGEVLHDGHQFVFNYGPSSTVGYLAVSLEEVAGRPVVRRSLAPGVNPGDTIVAVDGVPIEDVYARQYELTSTATHGYQFDVASRFISQLDGPVTLELLDTNGTERSVDVSPQSQAQYLEAVLPGESTRPSGPLSDLGAPNLYYLNMDGETSPTTASVRAAIAQARASAADALVLDMRGYPGAEHYEVAERLVRVPFLSPRFTVPIYLGPDAAFPSVQQYPLAPLGQPAWDGPIVLLTGNHAVSAAENFMQMLVGAGRLAAVVGRQSAGTNGNITGVQLPGGFAFTYTGMQVLNPDGSQFHGIGIVPDVPVEWTREALRNGVDLDLLAAVQVLNGP